MAIPVWPSVLPLADLSRQPKDPFSRTPMENGLALQRSRFRVYPITMQVNFIMKPAEYEAYALFAENDLERWVKWFMLKVRDKTGVRYARVRFLAAPKEELIAAWGLWRITAQVETLNIAFLVTEQEENIVTETGDKIIVG